MHICCVYIRNNENKIYYSEIPLDISYISSCLKQAGYTTEMLFVSTDTYDTFDTDIESKPQIFIISVMTEKDYNLALIVINRLKTKYKNSKMIICGIAVTLEPQKFIDINGVDALCIGAGEKSIVQYVKQVENGKYLRTDNLWIKTKEEIIKCDKVLTVEDLDVLPYPDRDGWNKYIEKEKNNSCSVLVTRGCIYDCIFCVSKNLKQQITNKDNYFSERKEEEILKEIDYLVKTKDIKEFILRSANVAANINKFKNLLELLSDYNYNLKEKELSFTVNMTFTSNLLDDNIINLMKKVNIKTVLLSLENGSAVIRKQIGKPNFTNEEFITFCKKLNKSNIYVYIYVMYCFPFESNKTWLETINVLKHFNFSMGFSYTFLIIFDKQQLIYKEKVKISDMLRFIFFTPFVFFKQKKYLHALKSFRYLFFKIKELREILKVLRNQHENALITLAKQEFDKGSYKQSIKYFNKINIKEDNYWIYWDRAIAKMNIKDYKGAIKDFDKILKIESKEIYIQKRKECLCLLKKIKTTF